ncbi:MAG: chitosanase, partial [Magnetospirillum sp.]|nr:chitosanase [Magnetospirillum sp.]
MAISDLQKKTAQAIVNIFETGRVHGDYGQVTLLAGDSGQLTYGRSQTTLASGNLYLLIKDYCAAAGANLASSLAPYLEGLEKGDSALNQDGA